MQQQPLRVGIVLTTKATDPHLAIGASDGAQCDGSAESPCPLSVPDASDKASWSASATPAQIALLLDDARASFGAEAARDMLFVLAQAY